MHPHPMRLLLRSVACSALCAALTETLPYTGRVRLAIAIGDAPAEPLTLGLFGSVAPKSVALFKDLSSGALGADLTYTGSSITRIERNRAIVGGSLAGGSTRTVERAIDRTGFVRSTMVNRADSFTNDDANSLSHDRPGLLSMRKGGGAFEFVLTPAANPKLDVTQLVIGEVDGDEGLRLVAALNELPARQPSQLSQLGGVASLYGLRLGLGFGLAGLLGQGLELSRREALAVAAVGSAGAAFIGSDPRDQPDLSYRPLTRVKIVSATVL